MEKYLKKSYQCLDLPYNATIDDVERREKALIKILTDKAKETNVSRDKEINEIKIASNNICENIKKNGIPNVEYHRFDASNESIIGLLIVLVFVVLLCFYSFSILM